MLIELRIQGYAVIDDQSLRLGPGFNVLTGETGAGKSIIVGALSLLLGERASSDVVRVGEDRAVVEAVFDISERAELVARLGEMGIDAADGLLILKREVQREGRSRSWVNGSPSTASAVWELGSGLVDLHGQHEHQTLLRRDEQMRVLDRFAGQEEAAARVASLDERARELENELELREDRRRELEARADFLRFQLGEIEAADPDPGEETELRDEMERLTHAQELSQTTERIHDALYGDEDALAARLALLRTELAGLVRFDGQLQESAQRLEGLYQEVAELGRHLGHYSQSIEHDPARLEELRVRQDAIYRLKRKYGPELGDVLETRDRLRAELEELDGSAIETRALTAELEATRDELRKRSEVLSDARLEGGGNLEERVTGLLGDLGMAGGTFRCGLGRLDEPGAHGLDRVDFRASLNEGFEPMPLSRVASGGELSRLMLALKATLAQVDQVPTLIFDEIDAGIGGSVATQVATRLVDVALHHQVFVITHLPQIASKARTHWMVEKGKGGAGVAATVVRRLEGEERVEEIARMLGGDSASELSRNHARELLST